MGRDRGVTKMQGEVSDFYTGGRAALLNDKEPNE